MKSCFILILSILCNLILPLSTLHAQQDLVINEFMADNENVLIDSTDNNFDDWIELYNASPADINLSGYYLSDDPSFPTQWPFPDVSIAPGEFLLIWADNDSGAYGLHTNFRLNRDGEFLGLYSVSGAATIAKDTLTFGSQKTDVSYGRFPDGSPNWQTFTIPTPGKPNRSSPEVDSSSIIFDDTKVHNYELHFYVTDWADSLEYNYDHGEVYMPAQLTYDGIVLDSIGVRYKGNSSYMMSRRIPKKPFKFKFDEYMEDQKFFGLKRLNFSNCFKDPSFMREKIGYDIIRKYMPATRAAYANIYVEGELIGFYVQVEQVDKTFIARYFENNDFNLYKASQRGASLNYRGTDQFNYQLEYELKTNEDLNDWTGLITMINKLDITQTVVFRDTMENYLNLDLCCRHLASNMVLSHFDSYTGSGRNFYLYDDSLSGQFQIFPWDLNETFGAFTHNWDVITADIVNVPNIYQRPLNRKILENESLRQVYLNYVREMINGPASYDSISAMVNRIKPIIDSHVQVDKNKLYTYQNFIDNIEKDVTVEMGMIIPGIKSFSKRRNENLQTQLEQYLETSIQSENSVAHSFKLYQNYPNPFNSKTTISFSIQSEQQVNLTIFNALGQEITTLIDDTIPAGNHSFQWQAENTPSGLYFYRFKSGPFIETKKMILLK